MVKGVTQGSATWCIYIMMMLFSEDGFLLETGRVFLMRFLVQLKSYMEVSSDFSGGSLGSEKFSLHPR